MSTTEARIINRAFGRGVASLRQLADLSQEELAPLLGISQSTLSSIERGDRLIRGHEWDVFCRAFADLLPGYDPEDCLLFIWRQAGLLKAVEGNQSVAARKRG